MHDSKPFITYKIAFERLLNKQLRPLFENMPYFAGEVECRNRVIFTISVGFPAKKETEKNLASSAVPKSG